MKAIIIETDGHGLEIRMNYIIKSNIFIIS